MSIDLRPYLMYLLETEDESGKMITQLKPFLSLSKINVGKTEASGYKVINIGKDIILLGGQHYVGHGDCIKSVWKFRNFGEPGEGEWIQEAVLQNPRRHHSMCTLNDDLYLIGGFGRHRVLLDSMERYHVPTGTWHSCRTLPEALYSAASCVFDGSIYVLGSQLYCYHPPSDMWTTINELSLPKNTGFSSAMPYKDYIYLTGIYTTKLMRFNPRHQLHYKKQKGEKDSWTLETVGNFRNKALNTCIVGHKIYSFALPEDWHGFEDECHSSEDSKGFLEIETYNITTETFEVVWTGSLDKIKLDGGGIIADFMTQHCAGCFSMIKF
ncbi:hypothetical protein J437_LFUL013318 [Ladona fulva]|uniref:Uncharacterized protein n=1 Tax=Ladona fulva TaxID=123851 RepID=A0A8K0KFG8_LADFU|nr:hypothetical protein J437_LFUL013318 [Ladona fulva]